MAAPRLTFQCLDIVKKRYVSCLIYNISGYLCYRVLLDELQKKEGPLVIYSLGNNDLEKYPL